MAITGILAAVDAAAALVKATETVYRAIDGARSCVITIKNHTDQQLSICAEGHESGGYKIPPDQFVAPNTFQVFGSQDKGFCTGSIGAITYRVGPDSEHDEYFFVRWANPFIGPNAAASHTYLVVQEIDHGVPGLPPLPIAFGKTAYTAYARAGSGEVGAEMLFELYRS